ncbi:MAG: electron transport complex subunit E [Firmicutes bacterium]|nr:electron transport complex subunit E [Bacillota bacterium]
MKHFYSDFIKGLWRENPTFRLLIGLCPTLAVTNNALGGFSMGVSTAFVLILSSTMISLVKHLIPDKVRIPAYIVLIATFVTILELFMNAYLPAIYAQLGIFLPLIVVNCIILGRAEAFASKMPVSRSIFDALGMGFGIIWALTSIGIMRELFGTGQVFGFQVMPSSFEPIGMMTAAPGAFITLGTAVAIVTYISDRIAKKHAKGKKATE